MQEVKEETESSSAAKPEGSPKAGSILMKLVVTAAVALAIVSIVLIYGKLARPGWVGVSGKTFWDYLDLLIVPAALAIGVYLLDRAQSERVRKAEEAQKDREKKAEDVRRKRELDVEKQRAENEYRKEFLMHILRAYNGAKKVRRVLAAHRSNDKKIPCSAF